MAYELVHGPIPQGVKLDHICRVRACCNPLHLRPSTSRRNTIVGASCLLKPGKTSQYLGVWRDGDKWGVKIHCGGTRRHLGRFTDEHTAGQVYQNIFNTIEWLEEHSDREIKPEALAEILGDGDWGTQPQKKV